MKFLDKILKSFNPKTDSESTSPNSSSTRWDKTPDGSLRSGETSEEVELRDMMKRAEMDADPIPTDDAEFLLTPEVLKEAGLAPEHLVTIGDRKIGLSGVFNIGDRDCAIGYVEDDAGRVKVRGYYQSGSQGVWRYLPEYICSSNGADITYFGKSGFNASEEKVTLPWQLQQKLGALASTEDKRKDREVVATNKPAWWFFAGTAQQYNSQKDLSDAYVHQTTRNDFYKETSNVPDYKLGVFRVNDGRRRPELVDIEGPVSPNFQSEAANFILPTKEYGPVQMRVFESADGKLEYLFGECREGAWLSSVQLKSEIGSTGCHKGWVEADDLVTPLHEYPPQSGGYGEPIPGRYYVNMWRRFLSRAPIIQKYLNRHNV